jgi:hypothetical protein
MIRIHSVLQPSAERRAQCELKSLVSRLQPGLYGVGDGVGALLMPPGAIFLLVDADAV